MPRKAQYGDVIKVNRTLYAHYGVYVGDKRVIHYTDEGGGDFKGMVQETSLESFLDGADGYFVVELDPDEYEHIYSPEETVKRARGFGARQVKTERRRSQPSNLSTLLMAYFLQSRA